MKKKTKDIITWIFFGFLIVMSVLLLLSIFKVI